jgi:hypothetical protein
MGMMNSVEELFGSLFLKSMLSLCIRVLCDEVSGRGCRESLIQVRLLEALWRSFLREVVALLYLVVCWEGESGAEKRLRNEARQETMIAAKWDGVSS